MIVRDEAVHGYYIGYKFQQAFKEQTAERQEELRQFTIGLLFDLYENEIKYTQDLYDEVGLTEDVKRFLRYNGNKALMNLGFDALWSKEETKVSAEVMTSLTLGGENHDFFSGSGSTYVMVKHEETEDDDWQF